MQMTVATFIEGDRFIYRIVKHLATNPANSWVNTYEVVAVEAGDESDLLGLGVILNAFEAELHKDTVDFEKLTISTWQPDSVPYDPSAFISLPLTTSGTVGPVGDQLALNQCLVVARTASFGRFGHLFYRGVLNEADTHAPAGKTILVDRAGQQDNVDAARTSSGLDAFVGSGATEVLRLAMISADGTDVRQIRNLAVTGATTLPTDHAWFNRRTITVP
jgi:hypothetical protein